MTQLSALVQSDFGRNDVQIMAGTFDEFSFDDVIQVLGLSRQCLRLLVRQGGAAVSEILLKAGQVLEARMSDYRDPAVVLRSLLGFAVRGSGLSFTVYHTEPNGPFPPPVGTLHELYHQAKAASGASLMLDRAVDEAAISNKTANDEALNAPTLKVSRPLGSPSSTYTPSGSSPSMPYPSGFGSMPWEPSAAMRDTVRDAVREVLRDQVRDIMKELLREDIREPQRALLDQVQHQGRMLHTIEGRLQGLPQLIGTDVRLALAQRQPKDVSGLQRVLLALVGVQTLLTIGLLLFLILRG